MLFYREKTENVIMRIHCIPFASNMPWSREEDVKIYSFSAKLTLQRVGKGHEIYNSGVLPL